MTKRTFVDTHYDVVSMIIAYGSRFCLGILKKADEHYEIRQYSLTTQQMTYKKEFHGEYIKMGVIEQNSNGEVFAVAYQDNGKFFVSIFNNEGEDIGTIDISSIIPEK